MLSVNFSQISSASNPATSLAFTKSEQLEILDVEPRRGPGDGSILSLSDSQRHGSQIVISGAPIFSLPTSISSITHIKVRRLCQSIYICNKYTYVCIMYVICTLHWTALHIKNLRPKKFLIKLLHKKCTCNDAAEYSHVSEVFHQLSPIREAGTGQEAQG